MDPGLAARCDSTARTALQGNLDPLALVAGGRGVAARDGGDPDRAEGAPVRVQSRPRHRAADAARACRRAGGAGACGLGSPSSCSTWADPIGRRRSGRFCSTCSPIRRSCACRSSSGHSWPAASPRAGWSRPRASYAILGGRSPLLELTRAQAAALEAELTGVRCEVLHRHALLASAQRRDRAGGAGLAARTRSCCCRCIRSIPPRRPAVR